MLTLYMMAGACSMAPHVALEEVGATYRTQSIDLAKGEQRAEAYLKLNPKGKVPALQLEDGSVLTENVAILTYLARRFPQAKLLPTDPQAEAKCLSLLAWLSNSVHAMFSPMVRPERVAADPAAHASVKETARATFEANLREIDRQLAGRQWLAAGQYTVCDIYALVFFTWGGRFGFPVQELANYRAMVQRAIARPAVRRAFEKEQNPLLKAA